MGGLLNDWTQMEESLFGLDPGADMKPVCDFYTLICDNLF